jgi:hypothetical protein
MPASDVGTPIPLSDKIEYLKAALECAALMRDAVDPTRGFDSARERQKLQAHIDGMLESLLALCLERDYAAEAAVRVES